MFADSLSNNINIIPNAKWWWQISPRGIEELCINIPPVNVKCFRLGRLPIEDGIDICIRCPDQSIENEPRVVKDTFGIFI